MAANINPEGYLYGKEPINHNPFWGNGGTGEDGVTFIPHITEIEGGYRLSWTNDGELENPDPVDIMDGVNGTDGSPGIAGENGVTFTPHIYEVTGGYQLSWTNDGGLDNPTSVILTNGADGTDGQDGADGVTPSITASATVGESIGTPVCQVVKTGTNENPIFTFNFNGIKGEPGSQGPQGSPGTPGQDGVIPSITANATVGSSTGTPVCQVTKTGTDAAPTFTFAFDGIVGPQGQQGIQGATGAQGEPGDDGADGITPSITAAATVDANVGTPSVQVVKTGTDAAPVFTFNFSNIKGDTGAQGAAGTNGTNGVGVPTGGSVGQVLAKASGTDYDTEWVNQSGGGGGSNRGFFTNGDQLSWDQIYALWMNENVRHIHINAASYYADDYTPFTLPSISDLFRIVDSSGTEYPRSYTYGRSTSATNFVIQNFRDIDICLGDTSWSTCDKYVSLKFQKPSYSIKAAISGNNVTKFARSASISGDLGSVVGLDFSSAYSSDINTFAFYDVLNETQAFSYASLTPVVFLLGLDNPPMFLAQIPFIRTAEQVPSGSQPYLHISSGYYE